MNVDDRDLALDVLLATWIGDDESYPVVDVEAVCDFCGELFADHCAVADEDLTLVEACSGVIFQIVEETENGNDEMP